MLQTMKSRLAARRRDEGGFTLIELMVVVLIIAILLAIAIPTFLGAQNKAKDRSAQSSLRNTVTAAKTIAADSGDYATVAAASLGAIEPSLSYLANNAAAAAMTDPKIVSVLVAAGNTVFYAAAKSKTGSCFYIRDDMTTGTATGGTRFATSDGSAAQTCNGDGAATVAAGTYKSTGW
jgi:type IV pilus assembly protein PilA